MNKIIWNQRTKLAMLTQLDNCTQDEFESSKTDFYVDCSKMHNRLKKKQGDTERRQVYCTRILNDK